MDIYNLILIFIYDIKLFILIIILFSTHINNYNEYFILIKPFI